jgi:hypothetical protein
MARPVDLCMKSMRNTTGLAPGAGVVELCSFPVTLSPQSRGSGRRAAQTAGSGDPPKPSPALLPCAVHRAVRPPGLPALKSGDSRGSRRPLTALGKEREPAPSHLSKNLHSPTIPRQNPRPVELCMKSMRNTTGLGPGAGVDVLRRFPVTLPPQSRGLGAGTGQAVGSGDPQQPSPAPLPSAVYRAARQAMPWTLKAPRSESRQPRLALRQPRLALRQPRLALQQPPRHAKPPRRRPPTARPPAGSGPVTPTPRPGWPLRSSGSCPRRA